MDLRYSPEEEAFRKRVREFLEANLPQGWGTPDYIAPAENDYLNFLRDWQRRLNEHGFLGMAWPKEYGGQEASINEIAIFNEEAASCRAPEVLNGIGLALAGPTLMIHGTEEQKRRHLPKILSCEEIWCQGFSEPSSGSDLASVRTNAKLVGDHFIVNGQKVWTSFAHIADWCMLLVRTDQKAPKHRGLTFLLVDMKTPGITVRPLRQMTGDAEFNELFFENVQVPRSNALAGLNNGWQVAVTTLMNERGGSGAAAGTRHFVTFTQIVEFCRRATSNGGPASKDPLIRQQLAQFYVELQSLKYTSYRSLSKIRNGGSPGPEGSTLKLIWSHLNQRMQDFVMSLQGPASQLIEGSSHAIENGRWQFQFLRSRANTIEAGSSEILRNILAERVLRLPRARS